MTVRLCRGAATQLPCGRRNWKCLIPAPIEPKVPDIGSIPEEHSRCTSVRGVATATDILFTCCMVMVCEKNLQTESLIMTS
jgi:hypothetical protein